MKRAVFLNHLREQGCVFIREGDRHSWWFNPAQERRSSVLRRNEIRGQLVRKIYKDLGIAFVK